MRKPRKFLASFILGAIFFAALSTVTIGYMWISSEYRHNLDVSEEHYGLVLEERKKDLREEVQDAVEYIDYISALTEERTMETVKGQVLEAHAVATNLYEHYKGRLPRERLEELVREALRDIRYNDGRGYYFATRLDGVEQLFSDRPELEGKNLLNMTDTKGKPVIRDMIAIAREQGEGFYRYHWSKPDEEGADFLKISYIKLFEPFGWLLGTGEYLDDVVAETQVQALSFLTKKKIKIAGADGYVFIGQWDGYIRSYPAAGRNMYDVTDANGVKIVQELIKGAKSEEGAFISYVMPRLEGERPLPKISFVGGVEQWEWFVGAGAYIDDIEREFEVSLQRSRDEALTSALHVAMVIAVISVVALILWYNMMRRGARELELFTSLFSSAIADSKPLETWRLTYAEFRQMAESANTIIIDRNRAMQELKQSEERFRDVAESLYDWVWEVDANGLFTYVSSKVEQVLGFSSEEVKGKRFTDFMAPGEAKRILPELRRVTSLKVPLSDLENWKVTKQGRRICLVTNGIPILGAEGELLGFRGVDHDITDEKRHEEQQREMEQQLRQSQKMEAVGTLAGGIAHDFNNILAAILGFTELALTDRGLGKRTSGHLNQILSATLRAKELVTQILMFSRKEKGRREEVQFHLVVREAARLLRQTIPTSIEIALDIDADTGYILGEPSQMHQIIMNLGTNAYHAMGERGGRLSISLVPVELGHGAASASSGLPAGSYARLTVGDEGSGIDAATLERIFDPFFTTKGAGEGTGIGLSVVHGIIKNHGGSIQVDSAVGEGTTFTVYLPLLEGAGGAKVPEAEEPQPEGGTERILVVDDEDALCEIYGDLLSSLGYRSTVLTSPVEALELFRQDPEGFDLLISDQSMPGMTGDVLAAKVMRLRPSMPVLICTGYSDILTKDKVEELGLGGLLMKPLGRASLDKAIRETLKNG